MTDLASDLSFSLGGGPLTKSLSDLISIVRFRGDMRNTVRFPDSMLTTEIQAAFSEGYELIVETNEGFYDTLDTVTTTANQAFVALPDGTWITRAIDRQEGNDWVPLPRVGVKDRNRYGTQTGRPCAHKLTERGIDLYPTPDAAYTLRVTFTPVVPILDSTQRQFYNGWEEYAVFGALIRLFQAQGRDESTWQKQLDRTAARIVKAAASRNSSGPEYLNLHEGAFGGYGEDNPDAWRPGF